MASQSNAPVTEERVIIDKSPGGGATASVATATKTGDASSFQRVSQTKSPQGGPKTTAYERGAVDADTKTAETMENKVDESGHRHVEYKSKITGPTEAAAARPSGEQQRLGQPAEMPKITEGKAGEEHLGQRKEGIAEGKGGKGSPTRSQVQGKQEETGFKPSEPGAFNSFEIAFDINGKEVSVDDPVFHVLRYTVNSHKATDKQSDRARVEIKLDAHKPWSHLVQGKSRITLLEAGGKALDKPVELSQGRQNWEIRDGRGWVWVIREDSPFAPAFKHDRMVLRIEHDSVPRLRAFMERKHHKFLGKIMPQHLKTRGLWVPQACVFNCSVAYSCGTTPQPRG